MYTGGKPIHTWSHHIYYHVVLSWHPLWITLENKVFTSNLSLIEKNVLRGISLGTTSSRRNAILLTSLSRLFLIRYQDSLWIWNISFIYSLFLSKASSNEFPCSLVQQVSIYLGMLWSRHSWFTWDFFPWIIVPLTAMIF